MLPDKFLLHTSYSFDVNQQATTCLSDGMDRTFAYGERRKFAVVLAGGVSATCEALIAHNSYNCPGCAVYTSRCCFVRVGRFSGGTLDFFTPATGCLLELSPLVGSGAPRRDNNARDQHQMQHHHGSDCALLFRLLPWCRVATNVLIDLYGDERPGCSS